MGNKEVVAAVLTHIIIDRLGKDFDLTKGGSEEAQRVIRGVIDMYEQTLRLLPSNETGS